MCGPPLIPERRRTKWWLELSTDTSTTRTGTAPPPLDDSAGLPAPLRKWLRPDSFYPWIALVALVAIWQVVVGLGHVEQFVLPAPTDIWKAGWANHSVLLRQSWWTLGETVLGFLVSAVVGIILAILIMISRTFGRIVYPLLVSSQAIPKVAIAPLFIIWMGFGLEMRILVVFIVAFFPVVVNTALGLGSVDDDLVQMCRSTGASTLQVFMKIRFPYAAPGIFSGLKVAVSLSVVGAIVSEFVGGNTGLGALLIEAQGNFEIPLMFADLVLLAVMGVLLFYLVEVLEVLLLKLRTRGRYLRNLQRTG